MQFFTVGPSQLYPTVSRHLQQALAENIGSISHRGKQYEALHRETCDNLRALLGIPQEHRIFFFSSATEVWERLLQNCVEESSFHLVNGSFSAKFFEFARIMGKHSTAHEVEKGMGFDVASLQVPAEAEAIAVIMNETSTGAAMSSDDIHSLAERHPGKLIFADVVTSVPAIVPDISKTDCAYFSVQKGMGMPAGLGVAAVSERAIAKANELKSRGKITGTYHSFQQLEKFAQVNQTPSTPNVLFIYLLGKVAGDMLAYGREKILNETRAKAEKLYAAFEKSASLSAFVKNPGHRSLTTLVANVENGSTSLIAKLKDSGMAVSSGYGDLKEKQIRIANFPAQTPEMTDALVKALIS